tara:strand:- start:301 stop:429 length:129 start_codon:yes stop_codon:yes gene_type:complete
MVVEVVLVDLDNLVLHQEHFLLLIGRVAVVVPEYNFHNSVVQ